MTELDKGLRDIPFLEPLDDHQIRSLIKLGKRASLKNGELLFRKGDSGNCMYVILEGRIQIYLESSEGRSAVLRVLEAGEFFGEMALLDGGARSANALALEPSELFVLHRTSFLDLVTTSPEMLTRLLAGLTERLRNTDERYLTQMLAGVTQELNAPLDAISANAGAIRRDLTTEAATTLPRELADRMWKAAGAIEKDSAHAHELLRKLSSRSS